MEKAKEAKKKSESLEVVFILDRSGSMSGREDDTIGGFNSTLAKQKKGSGKVIWSTVLFDDLYEVVHDRQPIEKIEPLTEREYYVRGCTALLDAVGKAVTHTKNVQSRAKEAPGKTLFVITTDGMENASTEYTYEKVKKLIDAQTEKGWEFIFLGANIDAAAVAGRMGIRPQRAATFRNDAKGIKRNYNTINEVMYCLRECGSIEEDALEEIRADYRKRKQ